MKKLSTLLALALLLFISCAKDSLDNNAKGDVVPDVVKKAFKADHPTVDAKWYQTEKHFEAVYKENNLERVVVFDKKGTVVATETELATDQIPASIQNYLNQNHQGQQVQKAEMEVSVKGTFYDIELKVDGKEVELVFDASGNFVGQEDDDGDDDDGDDDDDGNDDDGDDGENEVEINPNDLPQSIKDGVSAKYPGAVLLEADKITHADGSITYDVEFKKDGKVTEVMYDAQGKFLGVENDDDDQ